MVTGERGWGGERAIAVTLQRPQKPHKNQQSCWVSYWHLGREAGEEETERSKGLWSKPGALWLESSPVPTKRVGFGSFSGFCNTMMLQMAEARCGTSSNIWGGQSCSVWLPARIIPVPGRPCSLRWGRSGHRGNRDHPQLQHLHLCEGK